MEKGSGSNNVWTNCFSVRSGGSYTRIPTASAIETTWHLSGLQCLLETVDLASLGVTPKVTNCFAIDHDNCPLFCGINSTNHLEICSNIICESLRFVLQMQLSLQLRVQASSEKRRATRFTLVQNNPPGSWQGTAICSGECVVYGRTELVKRILKNVVFLEDQSEVYGFLRCLVDWVALRCL